MQGGKCAQPELERETVGGGRQGGGGGSQQLHVVTYGSHMHAIDGVGWGGGQPVRPPDFILPYVGKPSPTTPRLTWASLIILSVTQAATPSTPSSPSSPGSSQAAPCTCSLTPPPHTSVRPPPSPATPSPPHPSPPCAALTGARDAGKRVTTVSANQLRLSANQFRCHVCKLQTVKTVSTN